MRFLLATALFVATASAADDVSGTGMAGAGLGRELDGLLGDRCRVWTSFSWSGISL